MSNPLDENGTERRNSSGGTTEWLIQTMRKNAPILNFSRGEEYFTYNVPDYFEVVDLCGAKDGHVIEKAPLTQEKMRPHLGKSSSDTYLSIPKNHDDIEKGDRSKTRVYVHALGWKIQGHSGYDFQYFFFYAYNGPATLAIVVFQGDVEIGIPAGTHQGDWESVIVRTDTDGNIIGIYCNQHGDGTWYLPGEITWTGGHPNIYSAKSGHPSYVSIGSFITPKADWTKSILGLEFGAKLVNETSNGPVLQTAGIADLVATSFIPGAEVTAPWWLDYLGRYGLVVFTKQEIESFADLVDSALRGMLVPEVAAREAAGYIAGKVFDVLGELSPDGPEAPKAKGWWNKITPNGPSRYVPYRWSGDVAISKLPGHLDPQSDLGPSMAVYRNDLFMAYKHRSSNGLHYAFRDQHGWHGNTLITISTRELKSHSAPGLACYGGKIYLVYRHEDSDELFYTCFDDGNWRGNDRITTPAGNPKSSTSPALAEFNGQLHAVYKTLKSKTLCHAWFDGKTWRGNTPIVEPVKNQTMESQGIPALVAYNGMLYMFYLGAGSGKIYSAWFDGRLWRGNNTVEVHGQTLVSPGNIAPSAAVVEGDLMVFFVSPLSVPFLRSNICWAAYNTGDSWWGNESINSKSSIDPQTNQQAAVAAFDGGLVMVYKGHDHDDFYQSEFMGPV